MKSARLPACRFALTAIVAVFNAAAQAESNTSSWEYELTPYLFGAGLSGTTGVGAVTADVNESFSDILENLDSGFMALFVARKGPWSYGMEAVYFRLKDEGTKSWQGPLGNSSTGTLEATVSDQVYQLTASYLVSGGRTRVNVLGAARYTRLDADLNLVTTSGSPLVSDGSRSVSSDESWWDPVFGISVNAPLSEHWSLLGYADVGGFGFGSDLTYQFIAGVDWQFAESFAARFGYRYLYQDYDNDGFVWDIAAHGFYAGLGIGF
jgi:opacity protein-like surface antigen